MEYENRKSGHGTLALVLGIAAVIISLLIGAMFGMIGVIPGVIIAILAIVLGITSMNATSGRSGKGGLIIGIIAIVIAAIMGVITMAVGSFLKSDEVKENMPTLAAYADSSWKGIVGVIMDMSSSSNQHMRQGSAYSL